MIARSFHYLYLVLRNLGKAARRRSETHRCADSPKLSVCRAKSQVCLPRLHKGPEGLAGALTHLIRADQPVCSKVKAQVTAQRSVASFYATKSLDGLH